MYDSEPMRNRRCSTTTLLAVVGLLVAGCGGSGETTSSGARPTDGSVPTSDGETTTTKAISAQLPTLPLDPTAFDPTRLGDLFELSSFVLTVNEFHSLNNSPTVRATTYGYIKEPARAFMVDDTGGEFGTSQEYFVDGATLQNNNSGFWYLYANESLAAPDILQRARRSNALYRVSTAVFLGEAVFDGIPAYHYTFDETNLDDFSSYTPERPSPEMEGDFFLAKDGNQLLYAHSRMVAGAGQGYELIDEYTETLSSVNALAEITLPDDMLPLKEALDTGTSLGIPMPADGVVDSMINYNSGGIGVWYYQFTSSWKNEAEFIAFYQAMVPTNGWEVSHIGRVKNLDVDCADGNCVIIKNGDKQVILYFDGSNLHADYDREHRFSAQ